jgi:hypothetical protein
MTVPESGRTLKVQGVRVKRGPPRSVSARRSDETSFVRQRTSAETKAVQESAHFKEGDEPTTRSEPVKTTIIATAEPFLFLKMTAASGVGLASFRASVEAVQRRMSADARRAPRLRLVHDADHKVAA